MPLLLSAFFYPFHLKTLSHVKKLLNFQRLARGARVNEATIFNLFDLFISFSKRKAKKQLIAQKPSTSLGPAHLLSIKR